MVTYPYTPPSPGVPGDPGEGDPVYGLLGLYEGVGGLGLGGET